MTYRDKLLKAVRQSGSLLCVGLDPVPERLPAELNPAANLQKATAEFCKQVVDATREQCCAYKPNLAFFESLGAEGLEVFQEVCGYIGDDHIIVADAKRGDIATSAERYCTAFFDQFDVDALTLNPLMGFETLSPYLFYPGKAIYVLTMTSNPGANDFLLQPFDQFDTMAAYIADRLRTLSEQAETHIGMVVGATRGESLREVIAHHPKGGLLIPGIGKQGGSASEIADKLGDHSGIPLFTSSRSIIYAGEGEEDWQKRVAEKAAELTASIQPLTQTYV